MSGNQGARLNLQQVTSQLTEKKQGAFEPLLDRRAIPLLIQTPYFRDKSNIYALLTPGEGGYSKMPLGTWVGAKPLPGPLEKPRNAMDELSHQIVERQVLSPNVTRMVVRAARIAEVRQPGQFVILRGAENAERIPLTIADSDPARGTITLVIQALGRSTRELVALNVGDSIADIAGPLGRPTELIASGHAVCVGGGVGTAVVYPIAQGLQRRGVRVTSIIGGRSREWVIFENELRQQGEVIVCTDDGSQGRRGFVTDALRDLMNAQPIDAVYAVGPVPMMQNVANLTRPKAIHTIVSLNPIMVDGTGMCGGCRVTVGSETKFACVDGPEFDGHLVDFDMLRDRLTTYRTEEQAALSAHEGPCRVGI